MADPMSMRVFLERTSIEVSKSQIKQIASQCGVEPHPEIHDKNRRRGRGREICSCLPNS